MQGLLDAVGSHLGGCRRRRGGAELSLVHPARTRHPSAAVTTKRARVLLRRARSVSVIPPVPGMAPPIASVDAFVNGPDGAADMVHVDHGVDLTLDR